MSGGISEAKTSDMASRIDTRVKRGHRYRPSKGKRTHGKLKSKQQAPAGRYYRLLSGHAAIGSHPFEKIYGFETNECCWCDSCESRCHLVARCRAWATLRKRVWKEIGEACGWMQPRAPSVKNMSGDERATEAVLTS